MALVRMFAAARVAAGRGSDDLPGDTVADVLAHATDRYGHDFAQVLPSCRVWLNGQATTDDTAVGPADEIAVLPPVSGGCTP